MMTFFKSKFFKWGALGFSGLLLLSVVGVYAASEFRINRVYDVQPPAITIPSDAAAIAEGERLFNVRGCIDCHGENGAGSIMIDDPALGRIVSSNLTPANSEINRQYSDLDWIRAIRHGVGPDGKPLLVMPSQEFNGINDADLGAIIAYLKSLPAVENELPANKLGPLGRALMVGQVIPVLAAEVIDHEARRPAAITPGVTVEYGAYLAQTCMGCHGEGLSGGPIPGVPSEPPFPANLTPDMETGLGQWTEADFIHALRTGQRPDQTTINPKTMPWPVLGKMTDTELSALWLYLQSVPAKGYGNR